MVSAQRVFIGFSKNKIFVSLDADRAGKLPKTWKQSWRDTMKPKPSVAKVETEEETLLREIAAEEERLVKERRDQEIRERLEKDKELAAERISKGWNSLKTGKLITVHVMLCR